MPSPSLRVPFCGVIEGSVVVRDGETEAEAIARAEDAILRVLEREARRYRRADDPPGSGPVVGLEPDDRRPLGGYTVEDPDE